MYNICASIYILSYANLYMIYLHFPCVSTILWRTYLMYIQRCLHIYIYILFIYICIYTCIYTYVDIYTYIHFHVRILHTNRPTNQPVSFSWGRKHFALCLVAYSIFELLDTTWCWVLLPKSTHLSRERRQILDQTNYDRGRRLEDQPFYQGCKIERHIIF